MTSPDEERDLHLREALRHAPDASEGPPAALSESILQAARMAAQAPAAPRQATRPGWLAWWGRLAQPRMAGGLASVMLATLVGLIWWDRPMDEAMPEPPAPRSARAPAATPSRQPGPAAMQAPPAAPAPIPAPIESARDSKGSASSDRAAAAARERTAMAGDKVPRPDEKTGQREETETAGNKPKPYPGPAAPAAAAATGRDRDDTAKQSAAASAGPMTPTPRPAPAMTPPTEERLAQAEAKAPRAAAAPQASPAGTGPARELTALRARLSAEAARWSWQRGPAPAGIPPPSPGPALLDWLALLERSSAAAWAPPPNDRAPATQGNDLRLSRDGLLQHRFQLQGTTMWWTRSAGSPGLLQAELPADAARALQAALDELN